jgi:hypothetical protein
MCFLWGTDWSFIYYWRNSDFKGLLIHFIDFVLVYMLDRSSKTHELQNSWAETHRRHEHSGILPTILSSRGDTFKNFPTNFVCSGDYIRLIRIKLKFTKQDLPEQLGGYSDGLRAGVGATNVFLLHSVQTYSEAQPASYPLRTGDLSPRVKRPESEADHSPPSSTEVNNGVIPPLPQDLMTWCLIN